ncbi:MAG TPA: porin [Hyphomicrobium sp.]|nr:porin [Hyphomicrobium sp.]
MTARAKGVLTTTLILGAATLMASQLSAVAADLGGNCCADLEERIAELEAAGARKGNRKVGLTVSGWVNEAVFFWDDGTQSDVYVGTNELEQSRFRFNGDAKITAGWSAGYILEIGANGAGSKSFDQTSSGEGKVSVRKSAWYIKSEQLGRLAVGRFDTATYHLIDNLDTLLTRNVSDYEAAGIALGKFKTRSNGVLGARWTDFMGGFNNGTPGQSGLRNTVRYDTPELAGFTASASWGEDDQWETALRYAGRLGDFKLAASIGYGESTDPGVNGGSCALGTGDCQWWGAGALVSHTPTGIYLYGGYGENRIDLAAGQIADDTSAIWYLQGGIEHKWFDLGKTNIFVEHRRDDVGLSSAADSSDLRFWAAGVAQEIENASLVVFALYRHTDGDFTTGAVQTEFDALDMVITGARINF